MAYKVNDSNNEKAPIEFGGPLDAGLAATAIGSYIVAECLPESSVGFYILIGVSSLSWLAAAGRFYIAERRANDEAEQDAV